MFWGEDLFNLVRFLLKCSHSEIISAVDFAHDSGAFKLTFWEPAAGTLYSIDRVALAVSLPRRLIAIYSRDGLITPVSEPGQAGWFFDAATIHKLRWIERLRATHRLDRRGARLVFGLVGEIERLRKEMDYPIAF